MPDWPSSTAASTRSCAWEAPRRKEKLVAVTSSAKEIMGNTQVSERIASPLLSPPHQGEGASFSLTLPYAQGQHLPPCGGLSSGSGNAGTQGSSGPLRAQKGEGGFG